MDFRIRVGGGVKLTRQERRRIQLLKELDIQVCEFCDRLNILNLGWKPFKEVGCQSCERKHILCVKLCLKVARSIVGCEIYELGKETREETPAKSNLPYNLAICYGCGKELKGAGKHGIVKNRNNPSFWGIVSEFKILCLECMGKKYLWRMEAGKKKTFKKYVRREYV